MVSIQAYEKAKIEVFGDVYYAQDERWVGAVSFLEYSVGTIAHGAAKIGTSTTSVMRAVCCRRTGSSTAAAQTDGETLRETPQNANAQNGNVCTHQVDMSPSTVAGTKRAASQIQLQSAAAALDVAVMQNVERRKFSPMQEMRAIRSELGSLGVQLTALQCVLAELKRAQPVDRSGGGNSRVETATNSALAEEVQELKALMEQIARRDIQDGRPLAPVVSDATAEPPAEDESNAEPTATVGEPEP
eukprot:SAG11_NODE_731_length_7473_cov_5.500949_5_plen_245_part_00